ncbi:MAG: type VI secretion system baseplate subunit TssF [Planctomycetota bacterium]
MDPRLLDYYNQELQFIREMGGEFAKEYPKIASRLTLDGFECADPYVERLLEGFAFLAGRLQMKIDSEFGRFTQHLLEMVYPLYLAPLPSMAVVQMQPDLSEGALADGFVVPKQSVLRSQLGKGDQTACEYRTAHDVTLWPLELTEAAYFTRRDFGALGIPDALMESPEGGSAKAGLRVRLRVTAGLTFAKLALDRLVLFLRGGDRTAMRLCEQLHGNAQRVLVRGIVRGAAWSEPLPRANIHRLGFTDEEALLPYGTRSFHGYRLLQEYFALPERFLFAALDGLNPALRRINESQVDIFVLFDRVDDVLESNVDASDFSLFCTPAVNLFPKRADRIHLSEREHEYHVVPDRRRPMDFEIHTFDAVVGHGATGEEEREFLPFYTCNDLSRYPGQRAFFTVRRMPRVLSARQQRLGPRSTYVGHEVFVQLVDQREAPFHTDLKQLSVTALCTNRDLPLQMPVGHGRTDFTLDSGAPVESVRCVAGPTRPQQSTATGETAWRLVNQLSLNYLSLLDTDERHGAAALRELLQLYANMTSQPAMKQVEGVRSVTARPVVRQLARANSLAFGRGLEIELTLDEAGFEGTGVFLLGAVLEEFFARYVSINTFTETVVKTIDRGEVMRWPMRIGRRHVL